MVKKPGMPARGSTTGRPLMVLLDTLGQRWSLRILWELRGESLTFRALQTCCEEISPTVLNNRLKQLREIRLVELTEAGYGLTGWGRKIGKQLTQLDVLATEWAKQVR